MIRLILVSFLFAEVLAFSPPTSSRTAFLTPRVVAASTVMSSSATNEIELPPDATLDSLLDAAVRSSKLAGEIILGNAGGAEVQKVKANPRDLLTLIDPLCEKVCAMCPVAE